MATQSLNTVTDASVKAAVSEYQVPSKLVELDRARYEDIPASVATRNPAYITKPELATLVSWKLSHGTFRPSLKALVDQNSESLIHETTTNAFSSALDTSEPAMIKNSLTELTKLKGVGPATASLLLSVCCPSKIPFFSDELFRWSCWQDSRAQGWDRVIKYTAKEYLDMYVEVQNARKRMSAITAVDLEKAAYVLGKQRRKDPSDMASSDSVTKRKVEDDKRQTRGPSPQGPHNKRLKTFRQKGKSEKQTAPVARSSARLKAKENKS